MKPRHILILVAEDNEDHLLLTTMALRSVAGPDVHVATVRDGAETMDYLHARGQHEGAPRPDLLLLDLSMPRKNGLQVLEEIQQDEDLASLPVVVLTSSDRPEDVDAAYERGANAYSVKGRGLEDLAEFWTKIAVLPSSD